MKIVESKSASQSLKAQQLSLRQTLGWTAAVVVGALGAVTWNEGYKSGSVGREELSMNASQEGEQSRPETIITPVSCTKLPHVEGKSIISVVVDFPPNAFTPAHRHPGSVTVYVLKGRIRSQMEDRPAVEYGMGETWFEAPGELHAFAENASKVESAAALAIFVADNDCGPLVIPEPHHH